MQTIGREVTKKVSFARTHRARRSRVHDVATPPPPRPPEGRVPRLARLMALAIHFQKLIDEGVVENQADIARMSYVTRARVTQIMNLTHLAPDIQEAILDLPPTVSGRDLVREIHVKPLVREVEWERQRRSWNSLRRRLTIDVTSDDLTDLA